jgi:hypothetical protein
MVLVSAPSGAAGATMPEGGSSRNLTGGSSRNLTAGSLSGARPACERDHITSASCSAAHVMNGWFGQRLTSPESPHGPYPTHDHNSRGGPRLAGPAKRTTTECAIAGTLGGVQPGPTSLTPRRLSSRQPSWHQSPHFGPNTTRDHDIRGGPIFGGPDTSHFEFEHRFGCRGFPREGRISARSAEPGDWRRVRSAQGNTADAGERSVRVGSQPDRCRTG